MAGNRAKFEEAMNKANEMVWGQRWNEALPFYRRALEEFPDDIPALMGFGWALLNAGDLDNALQVYRRLTQLSPGDPGPYERIADIRARKNEVEAATQMYLHAANIYRQQGMVERAINAWKATVQINPMADKAWAELFKVAMDDLDTEGALLAAYWLAFIYQEAHPDWAIAVCRQLQQLMPTDPRLAQLMEKLQTGRPVSRPPDYGKSIPMPEEESAPGVGTPMEVTRQRAMEELAESIFAELPTTGTRLSPMDISLLISRALDAHTRGDLVEALAAYEKLIDGGVAMPSIHYNVGMIYKEQMRFDDAIKHFEKALTDKKYCLGSHYALGECYRAQGKSKEALRHFLEALKIVDLNTVERSQVDDLISVYEGLAQELVNTGEPERMQQLSASLLDFLGQRGWEEEALKARQRLDALARSGTVLSLAEVLSLPGSDAILRSVALAQEYLRRRKTYSALEEVLYALGHAPDYIPLHYLLGTILEESGNVDAALEKFRMIARTYEERGQQQLAATTYNHILDMYPLDIETRVHLLDMFIAARKVDEALGQYLQLADAYYQLAQPDRARDTYMKALNYANANNADKEWAVRIYHRLADLDMQRLDWQAAIKNYEEVAKLVPDDERAHLGLMRLYQRTMRPHLALAALDRLLKRYRETRRISKAIAVLEDLVLEEPESIPLRARLAQLYLNAGNREKALEHLDVLGDLQLENGQTEAAAKTIEAILALNPPNAEDYAMIYEQLTGQKPQLKSQTP